MRLLRVKGFLGIFINGISRKWSKFFWNFLSVCILTYDETGSRVLTASDESLIKVWSAKSGLLLMTLRGHEGEVMDMQVQGYFLALLRKIKKKWRNFFAYNAFFLSISQEITLCRSSPTTLCSPPATTKKWSESGPCPPALLSQGRLLYF